MTNQRRICLTLEANGWVSNVITNYGSRSKGYQHPRGGSVIIGAHGALTIYCGLPDCLGNGCRNCNQVRIRVIQTGATALVLAARHKRLVTQLSRGDISTTTSPSCVTTNT